MQVRRVGVALLKGAGHPALPSLWLDAHGPVGDRLLCAVDAEQRAVLRTVAHPRLLGVEARLLDEDRGLAGGWTLRTAAGVAAGEAVVEDVTVEVDYWGRRVAVRPLAPSSHAALLAEHLGRDLRLAVAPRGGAVYGGPVSVVARSTVRALAEAAGLDEPEETSAARLRATVVVDGGVAPFAEDAWAGRELVVGGARIRLRDPIVRCRVLDGHPRTGADPAPGRGVLRALAGLRERPVAGIDAVVTQPGVVAVGDDARLV